MLAGVIRILVAVLLALAIILEQLFYGGLMRTVFSIPTYGLLAIGGVLGMAALFWRRAVPPRLPAVFVTLLAAGYFLWRSLHSPSQELSLFYTFLVAACAAVYCLFACVLTTPSSRYVFVCLLFAAAVVQIVVASIQFTNPGYYWPLPWFSEQIRAGLRPRDALVLLQTHVLPMRPPAP